MPERSKRSSPKRRSKRQRRRAASSNNRKPTHKPKGIGASIGGILGNFAESGIRSLFGSGDYSEEFSQAGGFDVDENSIVKPLSASPVPEIVADAGESPSLEEGAIRIRHREFITDLSTQTEEVFTALRIAVHSGKTFPWLNQISKNFQKWILHGAVFEFVSTSGNAVGANTALGSISMATSYDAEFSQPFTTKSELLNTHFAVSTKPSENLMHAIECDPETQAQRIMFTQRPTLTPSGGDNWYEAGTMTVLTTGAQIPAPGFVAGELWITYDITLLQPIVASVYPAEGVTMERFITWLEDTKGRISYDQDDLSEFIAFMHEQTVVDDQEEESKSPDTVRHPAELSRDHKAEWYEAHKSGKGVPESVLRHWKRASCSPSLRKKRLPVARGEPLPPPTPGPSPAMGGWRLG